MDYPPILLPTLAALYELGERICAEVEDYQPDLVIGLAHSGWMPVTVAQSLWAASRSVAFPPTLRTNLGQEKHAVYKERFKPSMPGYCCRECCGDSPDRLGHYLAWISDQQPWLDMLHRQVQAAYPGDPSRILVVDDLFGGYRTCYLALGLLETLYPHAEVSMLAGNKDLTNNFVTAWLLQYAPELGDAIVQLDGSQNGRTRYISPWHENLKPLITGSEDATPDSLEWRALDSSSLAAMALDGRVDRETILAAPAWAASLATGYALQRQKGEIMPQPADPYESWFPRGRFRIEPEERLFRQAWLKNGITRKDIVRAFEHFPGGAKSGLQKIKELVTAHGRTRGTVYMPGESTESWLTAYDASAPLSDHLFIRGFAEFVPGKFWAGAYPLYAPDVQARICTDLINHGIRSFVDLTTLAEYHNRWPYQDALAQASQELGVQTSYTRFSLPFRAAPARQQMHAVLELLQSRMDAGERIYLHAGHNLEGRTPMALACLLIEQGYSAEDALSQVTDFWLQTLPYLIRLPLSDAQRRFVMRWKKK